VVQSCDNRALMTFLQQVMTKDGIGESTYAKYINSDKDSLIFHVMDMNMMLGINFSSSANARDQSILSSQSCILDIKLE
jgi:hypothetical protein